MRLIASDFYTYYRPTKCPGRVYLRHNNVAEAPPGPYEEVILRLGIRHEQEHLRTFPKYLDLSGEAQDRRFERTLQAVKDKVPVIYQGAMKVTADFGGIACEVVGQPDFMILADDGGYVVRDSKLSRRITEEDHPEIMRQIGLYGWLYERMFGQAPAALQVHSGTGDVVGVPYDGGDASLGLLQTILAMKMAKDEPYSPVGWSKCGGCGFHDRCWPRAVEKHDVALVYGVDQGLAIALREQGVETIKGLLEEFTEDQLAEFKKPRGDKMVRVGKAASAILRMAQALESGKEELIRRPEIPVVPNYVMFDLEGLPPHLDEMEKVYLWGMQAFGEKPGGYLAANAGFGVDGDREGWEDFLQKAAGIFNDYGDVPFVHWHHYERVKIGMYVDRFGDRDGIAARVRKNLIDLLPITRESIALPLPSYSLKVVEKHVRFQRTLKESNGEWSMAKYIEATETQDVKKRDEVLDQIRTYNEEDLKATWAVLQWLVGKRG